MYSCLKNIQILVALLKKYNVKNIVISPGTRHTPFVYSVEHDDFFKTYSIVDERSAGFFAIGLIEELHEPVAVVCTSGTAAANYVSPANEAFYQQLPLLLLTADRNHYYMFQQEEQMIPQEGLYSQVCKNVVTLGHVRDEKDFWYYSRICNEALLDLTQGEQGPVHINFIVENGYPVPQGIIKFDVNELPDVRKINRLTLEDDESTWKAWADKLKNSKVLIVYGQYRPLTAEENTIVEKFCEKYDVVISNDIISNIHTKYCIPTFAICRTLNNSQMKAFCPDIVITMNANSISEIKAKLISLKSLPEIQFEHWHVSQKGNVSDPFKILPDVVACSPMTFFKKFAELEESESEHTYYSTWKTMYNTIGENGSLNNEPIEYSSMYAIQQYIKNIPANSLLHIANSNSIRLSAYFDVDSTVTVYGNRGSHGIDGSMSAFVGQASVSDRPSFLVIGDLSFFYDMNALWNHYVGNNIRILVCNNSGGAIFHTYPNTENVPTLDDHIAAAHKTSVKDWVVSRGFKYLSAGNKAEFDDALPHLMNTSGNSPILLEVFTDKEVDAECISTILIPYRPEEPLIKQPFGKRMLTGVKETIKRVIY